MGLMRTVNLLDSDEIRVGAVGTAAIAADQVKQSELAYETKNLTFASGITSTMVAITSGAIPVGYRISEVSGFGASGSPYLNISLHPSAAELGGRVDADPGSGYAMVVVTTLVKP